MQPSPPPPPTDNRGIRIPLLLNAGLFLVLAVISFYSTDGNRNEALFTLAFLVIGQGLLNGVALVGAAINGKSQWVKGFALALGLLFLVGLGTCGLGTI